MRIALGLPHTPWIPERVESFARLAIQLGIGQDADTGELLDLFGHDAIVCGFTERAPNHVWSLAMWRWAAESGATHFLTLQDDVKTAPNFWPMLRAMLEAVPDQVIGLEAVHPAGPMLAAEGRRWYTTSDCLIGVGYVMPTELLREFLGWRAEVLTEEGRTGGITEDTMIGVWCLATGRRIWHPLPTIIDHDVEIASTYGNDAHMNRRPLVRCDNWTGVDPGVAGFWGQASEPVHLGRFYDATPRLARKFVKGFDARAYARARADTKPAVIRKLAAQRRAQRDFIPRARVIIATPTKGSVHPAYNATVWNALNVADLEVHNGFDLFDSWQWTDDVARCRSRLVRAFLETDATHLWFLDSDVSCSPDALIGMAANALDQGREVIATPYPRRDHLDFKRAAIDDGRPPEAKAYGYSIGLLPEHKGGFVADGTCAPVAWLPLGCSLLARSALERMTEHYREELEIDETDPRTEETEPLVGLFQLIIGGRRWFGEDQSFCQRWRAIGGTVWMYLGPGAPATHHGEHAYRGVIETFGLKHVRHE